MARLDTQNPSLNLSTSLKDAVIVLTGGSHGIGLATVSLLSSYGAKVVFGDISPPSSEAPANSTYIETDVSSYPSILKLFQTAHSQHGRVDHAISNAGIMEKPGWFDPNLGINGLSRPPPMAVEEINLRGTLWFAHIAVQYLSHGAKPDDNKSLTLLASIAAYKETPGVFIYETTKAGIIGLLRSLRLYLPKAGFPVNIRVNAVAPSATDTPMIRGIKSSWLKVEGEAPRINSPEEVSKVIVAICAAGKGSQSVWYDGPNGQGTRRRRNRGGMDWDDDEREARGMSGRGWLVLEGEAWDLEEGLDRTEDLWMGLSSSDRIEMGQKALGIGGNWVQTGGAKGEDSLGTVLPDP
jgi:NAD(P)-dependent dehydrogenase (short-subunit alcohol dehydrogenase family)